MMSSHIGQATHTTAVIETRLFVGGVEYFDSTLPSASILFMNGRYTAQTHSLHPATSLVVNVNALRYLELTFISSSDNAIV